MPYFITLVILAIVSGIVFILIRRSHPDRKAQRELDKYLKRPLTGLEVGRAYERYIGHLYEVEGYNVEYNGANNGYADLGRDLIVDSVDEILVLQTKCWAKYKSIQEKDIFQLFGSVAHFKRTEVSSKRPVRAIFYTTANYSEVAREVAFVLGVQLKTVQLNWSYPKIKCSVSTNGDKIYRLPFDPDYDKIKINLHRNEYFVHTVKEAVEKGFRRAE